MLDWLRHIINRDHVRVVEQFTINQHLVHLQNEIIRLTQERDYYRGVAIGLTSVDSNQSPNIIKQDKLNETNEEILPTRLTRNQVKQRIEAALALRANQTTTKT